MSVQQRISALNSAVKDWFEKVQGKLKAKFSELDIKHTERSPSLGPSVDKLEQKTHLKQGIIDRGSIKFPRHMVFVSKGVGKGVPAALAGTSATKRVPKDWFNSVIEEEIDELADKVADHQADISLEKFLIK